MWQWHPLTLTFLECQGYLEAAVEVVRTVATRSIPRLHTASGATQKPPPQLCPQEAIIDWIMDPLRILTSVLRSCRVEIITAILPILLHPPHPARFSIHSEIHLNNRTTLFNLISLENCPLPLQTCRTGCRHQTDLTDLCPVTLNPLVLITIMTCLWGQGVDMIGVVRTCLINLPMPEGPPPRALMAGLKHLTIQVKLDNPIIPNTDLSKMHIPHFQDPTMGLTSPHRVTTTVTKWTLPPTVIAIEDLACLTQILSKTFILALMTLGLRDMTLLVPILTTVEICQTVQLDILLEMRIIMQEFKKLKGLNLFPLICSISCSNLQQKTTLMVCIHSPTKPHLFPHPGEWGKVCQQPGYYGNHLRAICHRVVISLPAGTPCPLVATPDNFLKEG